MAYFLFSLGTACYLSKCELANGVDRICGVLVKITWASEIVWSQCGSSVVLSYSFFLLAS